MASVREVSPVEPQSWHHGLVARWWSLFRTTGPEIEYFRQFVQAGQPALDVACGAGRLLVPYVAAGLDVDGCDASPDMVALCLEAASAVGASPSVSCQAMHELDLPRRYRTIFVCGGLGLGLDEGTGPAGVAPPVRAPRAGRTPRPRQRGPVRRRQGLGPVARPAGGTTCRSRRSLPAPAGSDPTATSTRSSRGCSTWIRSASKRRGRSTPTGGATARSSPRSATSSPATCTSAPSW